MCFYYNLQDGASTGCFPAHVGLEWKLADDTNECMVGQHALS